MKIHPAIEQLRIYDEALSASVIYVRWLRDKYSERYSEEIHEAVDKLVKMKKKNRPKLLR